MRSLRYLLTDRLFRRLAFGWLLLAILALVVGLLIHPETQSVQLEGRLWGVYTDNPSTRQHGLDYFLHTAEGKDYSLQAEDVSHIPVGSRVRLEGTYPYGLTAAGAILDVPRVNVIEAAPPLAIRNGGTQRWLSIYCKYSDHDEEPYDLEFVRRIMSNVAPGMGDYYGRVSNHNLVLDGRKVVGPYQINVPHYDLWSHWDDDPAKRIFDVGRLGNLCAKEAENDPQQQLNLASYDGIIFFLNFQMDGTAKGGTMYLDTGKTKKVIRVSWIPDWGSGMLTTTAHEIGHGEEFGHSTDSRSMKDHSLGNPWDVMGDVWIFCHFLEDEDLGCVSQYPMAYWRKYNGWIKTAIADHTSGVRVYHIGPAGSDTDKPQALFIPIQGDVGYMIEVRRPMGPYESKLPPGDGGALLTWISPKDPYKVKLIDMDDDKNDNPDDGSAIIQPVRLLGGADNTTMCFLANDDDGAMTIAVGKQGADCSKS